MFEKIYDASMRLVPRLSEDKELKLIWWAGFLLPTFLAAGLYFQTHYVDHWPFDLVDIYIFPVLPIFWMILWLVSCGPPPK